MDTIIDQQVAMNEALVSHARRLRIGRSNFRLLSDISSKESTLQLLYNVLRLTPFFKAFLIIADVLEIYMQEFWATTIVHYHYIRFKMDNKKHIVNLESFREIGAIRKLTNVNISKLHQPWRSFAAIINKCLTAKSSGYDSLRLNIKIQRRAMRCIILGSQRNSNAYKEYYAVATGATPPKPKASVWKTRSSYDTTVTPPTTAAGPRLSTSAKGKQPATTSKAKSLSALSKVAMTEAQQLKLATKRSLQQTHISQASSSGTDEGTGTISGVPDVPTDDLSTYAEEETRDEESFDPIPKTPENTDDKGNGEENLGINVGREEGHDEEEEEDELYRDVNTNLRRGIQMTQEFEDSHVTLTPVNPDGQQQSSSVSSQFVTSMLNPTPNAGMESIFKTTSQMDVQTPTSVSPLLVSALTISPSTIATITTTQQAPTPTTTAPSTLLQDLPNFGSLFRFDNRLKTLEANFFKFMQTNQFVGAVSSIPGIVQRYMDQRMNEAIKVAVQIQSDCLRDEAQTENDEFLKTIDENMQKIIKEQVKEQVKTSYVVVADLFEMELKKILIEKMEGNKSIHRSNEQRNLYKALVKAYESDKIILGTYGDIVTLKRRRDDDADKDEEPLAELDWGSNRRREGKEPESASAPKEKATRSAGRHVIPFDHFINNDLEYLRGGASSRKYTTSVTKINAADYGHIKWIEDLFYGFAVNRESARDVYSKSRIIAVTELKIVEWHNYKHLDWIMRKEAYIAYSNPRGFIYQNKDKQNRLMRIDELHKFSDGTLTDVRTALDDRLKGIRMKYLPQTIWRKSNKERAAAMIQAIDKMLKTRRIMRSLERFVGGRLYEGDFRMLQRTI
nr:hypothetical protein [Tanacetum cinerariifolium]